MGLTHVTVKLRNPRSTDSFTAKFLVDTGALDSMAPASTLRNIGIEPVGKNLYELANGELQEYEYGIVEISVMDEITAGNILFGPENTEPLLGVITLQSAGFIVDPATETLKKLPVRSLKIALPPKIPLAA